MIQQLADKRDSNESISTLLYIIGFVSESGGQAWQYLERAERQFWLSIHVKPSILAKRAQN